MPTLDEMVNTPSYEDNLCDAVVAVISKRKSLGMSQEDLAKKAEVEPKDISALESFAFNENSYLTIWKALFALGLTICVKDG